MQKTILVTGSTDGIGLATAKMLASQGHAVLLHGRNPHKLADAQRALCALPGAGPIESHVADLSRIEEVEVLAAAIGERHGKLDVLINNAGILRTSDAVTRDGLDVRFVVNTVAPICSRSGSCRFWGRPAAWSICPRRPSRRSIPRRWPGASGSPTWRPTPSKLALTMWSRQLALMLGSCGPLIVAVNPGSMLGSKMVKEGFGVDGGDIGIGADILVRAALSDEFATATGKYFDNDSGRFASPHPDALDQGKSAALVQAIESLLFRLSADR